jgi:hypothetical protein
MYLCQLLFIICYPLFINCACYLLLSFIYFVHCSTIYLVVVTSFLINSLFRCSKNNSDPELVFGYFDPANHHQYESINIIQQTPLTLS